MQINHGALPGVKLIKPTVHGDSRGWFFESYNHRIFSSLGIEVTFVQDNHSFSAQRGTLRGLHLQRPPSAQAKLVRCIRGAILDVVVDLRPHSPTYKQWLGETLSEDNHTQMFIPTGLAHGFVTLTDDVEIQYKVDNFYAPDDEVSIRYDDPELGIDWGVDAPVLSQKDSQAPFLQDLPPSLLSSLG